MGVFQKLCCGCSADVAEQVRVKDQEGRYFCQPCFETKTRSKMPEAAFAGFRSPAPEARRSAPQPEPEPIALDDSYDIAFVEPVKAAPPPPKTKEEVFGCADCKKLVTQRQIRNDDGDFVCIPCFTKRRKNATSDPVYNAPVRRKSFAEEDGVSDALPFTYTFLGGALISFGVLIFSWFLFLGLTIGMDKLPRGITQTVAYALIMATFQTLFVLFRAFSLMVSLFLVSKIMGGCDFGSLGYALWRTVIAALVFALVTFFMEHSATFILLGIPIRGVLFYAIFMGVFKLDRVEASLLSVINFFIFVGLSVAMAVMVLKAVMILRSQGSGAAALNPYSQPIAMVQPQMNSQVRSPGA